MKDKDTWWSVDFRNVKYNGSSISKSDVKNAIIDSGTSFIYLAQSDYDQLKMRLENVDGLICDSNRLDKADQYCKSFT